MYNPGPQPPKWRRRADAVGFRVLNGRAVYEMSEEEIEAAFQILSRDYGISYIWCGEH